MTQLWAFVGYFLSRDGCSVLVCTQVSYWIAENLGFLLVSIVYHSLQNASIAFLNPRSEDLLYSQPCCDLASAQKRLRLSSCSAFDICSSSVAICLLRHQSVIKNIKKSSVNVV